MLSRLLLETIVYATSYVIELVCNPLLMCWAVALLHEEIVCACLMNCSFYCIAFVMVIICPTAKIE